MRSQPGRARSRIASRTLNGNAVGTIGDLRLVGRSRSVDSAGTVLAEAASDEETLLVAPVGTGRARQTSASTTCATSRTRLCRRLSGPSRGRR